MERKNGIYIDDTYHAACKVEYQLCNLSNSQLTCCIILLKKLVQKGRERKKPNSGNEPKETKKSRKETPYSFVENAHIFIYIFADCRLARYARGVEQR